MGLSALVFTEEANIVIEGLLKTAGHFENYRLPKLFCSYPSSEGRPVRYPVTCSPQTWAAGTPLVLLSAMLGIRPDFAKRTIRIDPSLPRGINRLHVRRLRIGDGILDIQVARSSQRIEVEIANTGTWQTLVEKSAMQHA